MPPDFSTLESRLRRYPKPDRTYGPVTRRAAVTLTLRDGERGAELLMIRRAARVGDPWSGHMGFPGGRRDRDDANDLACALRETREEIDLDLDTSGRLLCELGDVNTGWRPDRPEMLVAPFVFTLDTPVDFVLNHEVDEIVWVPLVVLMDAGNRVPHRWEWRGQSITSDSLIYQQRRIWGLSLGMIDELIEAISQ